VTRGEAVEAAERLAAALERDLALAATRGEHLRIAQRVAEARALAAALRQAPPAAAA